MWSPPEPVAPPTSDSSTTSSPGHISNPPNETQPAQGLGSVAPAAHLLPPATVPLTVPLREVQQSNVVRILLKTPFVVLMPLLPQFRSDPVTFSLMATFPTRSVLEVQKPI